MLGIHTVYTKPKSVFDDKSVHENQYLFEVLTMVLSCLNWKRHCGPIKLYCDQPFYDYIDDLDLLWLWDEIDTETIQNIPGDYDSNIYWAYAKVYINSLQTQPFASLDTDLYIRGGFKEGDFDILFCNIEKCDNKFGYPPYHKMEEYNEHLIFDGVNDYAANVALLVVNDLDFYKEYVNVVNEFVFNTEKGPLEGSAQSSLMTFTEQRILYGMLVDYNKKFDHHVEGMYDSGTTLFEDEWFNANNLTHLWGWKHMWKLERNEHKRNKLTNELIEEVMNDFPDDWDKCYTMLRKVKFI